MEKFDVIIIGASAAGLMCAIEAGKRGRHVLVLDQANKAGRKILMSGGGRCNFTNYSLSADNYLSNNPHFCKSALKRFSQWDFLALVQAHGIAFHQREHGQLFCDHSSQDILNMLLLECQRAQVNLRLKTSIEHLQRVSDHHYKLQTDNGSYHSQSMVIASGGLSIPSMGSSPFGYKIAEQFAIKVWPTRAGLVPFTLQPADKEKFSTLAGIAVNAQVSHPRQQFRENILFTHRGLSGPAILQISSYWQAGENININLMPDIELLEALTSERQQHPQVMIKTLLAKYLPKRLVAVLLAEQQIAPDKPLQSFSHHRLKVLTAQFQHWVIKPNGTEGYRTAEVTLGGVDCDALSSKTMQSRQHPGLYFIGEVVDVTGWLGGYNFQWAWSSGWCAGQVV